MPERFLTIGGDDDTVDSVAQDRPAADQSVLSRAGLRAIDPPFSTLNWLDRPTSRTAAVRSDLRWGEMPGDGWLVQLSFVVAANVSVAEFEERYRSHVEVARRHHPGVVRYVQHVAQTPEGLTVDPPPPVEPGPVRAVSELWFVDEHSLVSRYWADETSRDAVRSDNAPYVDFTRSWSVLCRRTGTQRDLALGASQEDAR